MYQIYDALRKERKYTESYVSEQTGIAMSTFWRWKHGKFMPRVEKLKKIADFFGVPVTVFFEGGGE